MSSFVAITLKIEIIGKKWPHTTKEIVQLNILKRVHCEVPLESGSVCQEKGLHGAVDVVVAMRSPCTAAYVVP